MFSSKYFYFVNLYMSFYTMILSPFIHFPPTETFIESHITEEALFSCSLLWQVIRQYSVNTVIESVIVWQFI
jgi:hypothetical protein